MRKRMLRTTAFMASPSPRRSDAALAAPRAHGAWIAVPNTLPDLQDGYLEQVEQSLPASDVVNFPRGERQRSGNRRRAPPARRPAHRIEAVIDREIGVYEELPRPQRLRTSVLAPTRPHSPRMMPLGRRALQPVGRMIRQRTVLRSRIGRG